MINLSAHKLTVAQESLLKRGLKFTPTPLKSYHVELEADVRSFSRTVRLKEFFHEKDAVNDSIFRKPSNFTPKPDRDENLDLYCDFLQTLSTNLESLPVDRKKDNLSKYERSALKELQNLVSANEIVIQQADKGGAVVIMDANHYKTMIHRVFNNPDYFEPSNSNQSRNFVEDYFVLSEI